MVQGLDDILSQ